MDPVVIGVIGIVLMVALMVIGVPLAFTFGIIAFIGTTYFMGLNAAMSNLFLISWSQTISSTLMAIPLFVVLGELVHISGIGAGLFNMFSKWFGRLKGGLAMAAILTGAAFAACSGSSLASVLTVGKVSYEEMKKRGYLFKLNIGSIAAAGTLAILIPPSNVFVVYSSITDVSLGKLFLAGIIPGIILTVILCVGIFIYATLNPHVAPGGPETTWAEKFKSLPSGLFVIVLFLLMLGGIFVGWFSPNEAASVGIAFATILTIAKKKLTWPNVKMLLLNTSRVSCMLYLIVIMASYFGYFLALSTLPKELANWVISLQLPPIVLVGIMVSIYLPLGCLMEVFAMLVLTLPIMVPIIHQLGFDLVWFGILVTIMCEIGQITPPVGLGIYALKTVAPDASLEKLFSGVGLFVILLLIGFSVIFFFPETALYLPRMMKGPG
jgi:C4-dicarboxylate transporter, DctM subunit